MASIVDQLGQQGFSLFDFTGNGFGRVPADAALGQLQSDISLVDHANALREADQAANAETLPCRYDRFGYVQVHFVKGDRQGEAFAKQVADRLTFLDKRINALPDNVRIPVKAENGDILGHLTGKRVKEAWNNQRWEVHPQGTDFGNGRPAATGPGLTRLTAGVSDEFRYAKGQMSFDTNLQSLIAHEMGHVWNMELGKTRFEESMANEAAAAVMNAIGSTFRYDSNSGGRMLWDAPDYFRN